MVEVTHESMDTDVLCDVKSFEIEVGLTEIDSMPQRFET
jgi:hypothetical protein